MEETYQIYVKLLNGKSRALNFASPSIPVSYIKSRIQEITGVPVGEQRLVTGTEQLEDFSSLLCPSDATREFPTIHLLLRLRGGKGGFGSLLRGAATKAGQKKTNNFDACRDMSGRRLRHVNAEKKLEEWRAEAEERRLEKIAEEFIKKKVKVAAKKGGSGDAEKYVERYREESSKCMEVVEKSVREAIGSYARSKRKMAVNGISGADAKRMKLWMGKRKLGDSDNEDTDESDNDGNEEEENEKSVILDNSDHSETEAKGSSGSVTGGKLDGEFSGGSSFESGSEEEKETTVRGCSPSGESSDGDMVGHENNDAGESAVEILKERVVQEKSGVSVTEGAKDEHKDEFKPENLEETAGQPQNISHSVEGEAFDSGKIDAGFGSESQTTVHEEIVVSKTNVSDMVKPLNFDEFNSAAELEALGMERLKSELQSRGLKCGGTLQERAARLFLLKTTPLEKLPKKLLAKK
ncbi:hypothetical protein NMG60_11028918 [Bertholletia excelsa]